MRASAGTDGDFPGALQIAGRPLFTAVLLYFFFSFLNQAFHIPAVIDHPYDIHRYGLISASTSSFSCTLMFS